MKTRFLIIGIMAVILLVNSEEISSQLVPVLNQTYAYFKTDKDEYPIQYNLTNGNIGASLVDLSARALIFTINSKSNGQLSVELPRKIIDSTRNEIDKPYFVSLGGLSSGLKRINADEVQTNNEIRVLRIDFPKGQSQIQIVGTFFVENNSARVISNPYGAFSPLKQWQFGIDVQDIVCKDSLVLLQKLSDHSIACVSLDTSVSMIERNWGQYLYESGTPHLGKGVLDLINYDISNGVVNKITPDIPSKSVTVEINAVGDGDLSISLPRIFIDAGLGPDAKNGMDDSFFVLINVAEVDFEEKHPSKAYRHLVIPFSDGPVEIEIIGTNPRW